MREQNVAPVRVSRAGFENTYWTLAQMVTHHTSNGCNLRSGDLLASGTVSGEAEDSFGCLLELPARAVTGLSNSRPEKRVHSSRMVTKSPCVPAVSPEPGPVLVSVIAAA